MKFCYAINYFNNFINKRPFRLAFLPILKLYGTEILRFQFLLTDGNKIFGIRYWLHQEKQK
jgi:hypothetical protein